MIIILYGLIWLDGIGIFLDSGCLASSILVKNEKKSFNISTWV